MVARSISPSASRTTWPPLRSIAGKMINGIKSSRVRRVSSSSRFPCQKPLQQRDAVALALLGVKLNAGQVVAADRGGDLRTVLRGREHMLAFKGEAVQEI